MTKSTGDAVTDDDRATPWRDRAPGGDGPEDRLAMLLREGAPTNGLTDVERARVWSRLTRAERRSRPLASLRWSVAFGILLTSGAVIGAVAAHRWWPAAAGPERAVPAESPPVKSRRPHDDAKRVESAPEAHAPTTPVVDRKSNV